MHDNNFLHKLIQGIDVYGYRINVPIKKLFNRVLLCSGEDILFRSAFCTFKLLINKFPHIAAPSFFPLDEENESHHLVSSIKPVIDVLIIIHLTEHLCSKHTDILLSKQRETFWRI